MEIHGIRLTAEPMLYVTATATMAEIPDVMGRSFAALGEFFGKTGIVPVGSPLAVYHDWTGDKTGVDVGFPVAQADAAKAQGAILRGTTPDGHALKTVHVGPYGGLSATYAAMAEAMKAKGIPENTRMWEVYRNEPGITPDAELITEVYASVSAADASKFPA